MSDINIHLHIRITPKALLLGAVGFLFFAGAAKLGSESLTMSTTYPSPSGIYNQLITTGNTYLARNNGGMVGIGTTNPQATLDVNGAVNATGNLTLGGGVTLRADGTDSGPLQVVWSAASPGPAGYYAAYAP